MGWRPAIVTVLGRRQVIAMCWGLKGPCVCTVVCRGMPSVCPREGIEAVWFRGQMLGVVVRGVVVGRRTYATSTVAICLGMILQHNSKKLKNNVTKCGKFKTGFKPN